MYKSTMKFKIIKQNIINNNYINYLYTKDEIVESYEKFC